MSDTAHEELAEAIAMSWVENTGCSTEAAIEFADRELGGMHDGETCPICFPVDCETAPTWTDCGWQTGTADEELEPCEIGFQEFPGQAPNPGCDACRARQRWTEAAQWQARRDAQRSGDPDDFITW